MITRDIYINSKHVTPPIRIVYGTDNLPVQFCMKDVTLASGNTAKFYSLAPSENRYEQTGTIDTSAGTITFTPEAGFFETGQNLLQCEIKQGSKFLYSFAVDVLCAQNLLEDGTAAEAEAIKTYVERAEDAADSAEASAQAAQDVLDSIPHDYSEMSDMVDDLVDETEALDTNIMNAFPTGSASGAVASFPDGADGIPIKDMLVNITPVQAGSGDPSPTNIRAISGWDACNITVNSKNIVDSNAVLRYSGIDQDTGEFNTTTTYACSNYLDVSGIDSVMVRYYKSTSGGQYFRIARYDANKALIDFDIKTTQTGAGEKTHITDTSQCEYIAVMIGMTNIDSLIVAETWNRYTIQLGQTVYGGTLNLITGHGLVTNAVQIVNGSEAFNAMTTTSSYKYCEVNVAVPTNAWETNIISNMYINTTQAAGTFPRIQYNGTKKLRLIFALDDPITVDDLKAQFAATNLVVVYPLASPTPFTVSPTQITTLLGQNNIWSDSGDVSVTYRADPTLYIDGQITPIKAMVASEETGTTASQAYTAGQYFILGGQFCKALTNIASGATFTLGTNYSVTTIGAELYSALNS